MVGVLKGGRTVLGVAAVVAALGGASVASVPGLGETAPREYRALPAAEPARPKRRRAAHHDGTAGADAAPWDGGWRRYWRNSCYVGGSTLRAGVTRFKRRGTFQIIESSDTETFVRASARRDCRIRAKRAGLSMREMWARMRAADKAGDAQ